MNERRAMEWGKFALQILLFVAAIIGAYYKLDARVTMTEDRLHWTETKVEQETKGYAALQQEFVRRLERMEDKLDQAIKQHR